MQRMTQYSCIVMWWGGLRGAVGLALGLIVSSDELWKEMDIAYCNEHPCCETTCKIRQRYYQTAFSDVFLIHVSFIVLLTIVFNGVSTATVVKRLGLSKKESKLEHLNFDRICTEIDEKLKERKEELQREDVIHVGHTKKEDTMIGILYLDICQYQQRQFTNSV